MDLLTRFVTNRLSTHASAKLSHKFASPVHAHFLDPCGSYSMFAQAVLVFFGVPLNVSGRLVVALLSQDPLDTMAERERERARKKKDRKKGEGSKWENLILPASRAGETQGRTTRVKQLCRIGFGVTVAI